MALRDAIPRKLTYEDYLRFPDDGLRHELIAGDWSSLRGARSHQPRAASRALFSACLPQFSADSLADLLLTREGTSRWKSPIEIRETPSFHDSQLDRTFGRHLEDEIISRVDPQLSPHIRGDGDLPLPVDSGDQHGSYLKAPRYTCAAICRSCTATPV